MSLGTEGWGHVDLAKKLGGKARKRGCGEAEIRWGLERKSYSGAGLVSGLGRGQGSRNLANGSWHWSGKGSGNRVGGKS